MKIEVNIVLEHLLHEQLFGYVGAFSSAHVLKNGTVNSIMPPLLEKLSLPSDIETSAYGYGFRFV